MAWYDSAFAFKKSIVIPHGNVSGGSDLLDFPVLISVIDSKLAAMLNGGQVYSLLGYDILFTDASETRELAYEIESYNNSTGALLVWVRIPVLSASQDTVLYLYFSNSTVTGYQAVASNVWNSGYTRVYHLGDASTLSVADSTTNAANGTNSGATATTGEINGGASFNGTTQYVSLPTTGLPTGAASFTASLWGSLSSLPGSGNYPTLFSIGTSGTGATVALYFNGDDQRIELGVSSSPDLKMSSTPTASTFYYLTATYDGATLSLYVNGVLVATKIITMALAYGASRLGIDIGGSLHFGGVIDEVQVSNVARSASWIATEYTNQNNPSSFIIVGQSIPLIGNVDISALVALGVTTTQAGVDQINVAGRGANFAVNVSLCGVGETFTLKIQGKDGATGQYYTIGSFSGIGLGNSFFTVYPGLNASSTIVDAVLPRTWRATMTPSTGDFAAYTVGASLIR